MRKELDFYTDVLSESIAEDQVYIDQEPCQPFNLNEAGWPRNDISAYELASTDEEAKMILERLREREDQSIYKNMSEEQMFESVCPRRAYTDPVLFARFVEQVSKSEYAKVQKELAEINEGKDKESSAASVESSSQAAAKES